MVQIVRQCTFILLLGAGLALAVNTLRPDHLPLVGDWSVEGRLETRPGEKKTITIQEARTLQANGQAVFLDARPVPFYEFGHIKGARSLPPDQVEARGQAILKDLGPETTIVTYCDGPTCDLSLELAAALTKKGYHRVLVLENGWTQWEEKGLPAATGPDGSRP